MALKEFFLSKIFGKHLLAAFAITILLLWLVLQILSVYTHRGESLSVPDFSGMSLTEARQVARKMNLRFEVLDSVYRGDKRVGTILMQNPGAGHRIKSGRLIYLTLVSSIPGQEEVPKLTDISFRQAKVLLESKGFSLGRVEYVASEFNDLVLAQKSNGLDVQPGSRLNNGTIIDLVVGQNLGNSETFVPDFLGLTIAEAQIILDLKQLQLGTVDYAGTAMNRSDSLSAIVISQSPAADSTLIVPAGTMVNLVLSNQAKE